MSYSDIYLYQRTPKLPTIAIFGILVLVSLVVIKAFSTRSITSKASLKTLRQVEVVNLGEGQAGIFWQTDKKETGWVIWGNKKIKLDQLSIDERDTSDQKQSYFNHYVLLRNLLADRDYFFKIVSDNQLVAQGEGQPFSLHTLASSTQNVDTNPAYGKVVTESGQPLKNGVVLISFDGTYPILGILKLSGEWLLPLNSVVDQKTNKIRAINNLDVASIKIYSEENQLTTIKALVANVSPLPETVVINKNYSFLQQEQVLSAASSSNNSAQVSIIYPKENAIIPAASPLIKGTAFPGQEVIISIHSVVEYTAKVIVGKDGIWTFYPERKLSPGSHTLTIVTKDNQGREVKLSRLFTIAKSGEQVLGNATPEPTLTGLPTAYPTSVLTTVTPESSPSPTILKSGFDPAPLAIVSGGFLIVGLGIILAF